MRLRRAPFGLPSSEGCHESRIRVDARTMTLDECIRLVICHSERMDEISDNNGRRSGDTLLVHVSAAV